MRIIACLIAATLAGCASYAGPFITEITSDGRGQLELRKCMLKLDTTYAGYGNMPTNFTDCHTTPLRVTP